MRVPNGWQEVKISEIASVDSGQGAPQGEKWYNGEEIFVKAGDLNSLTDGKYVGDQCQRITNEAIVNFNLKKYRKNSVVFPKSGMSVKTDNIALLKYDSYVVNHLAVIQPKKNGEDMSKYLYYFLRQVKISKLSVNPSYPSIRISDIRKFKVIIPLDPQLKKIVAILDKADNMKQWREESDKLTNDFLVSVFLEMFGDPIKNPHRFDIVKLKNVFSKSRVGLKCGPFGSALKKSEYVKSGVPVWTMDNIVDGVFSEEDCLYITDKKFEDLKSYQVQNGDIIISRAGTVGKMCVINSSAIKSIISTNLIKLSLDRNLINPIYFTCLMEYCKGRVGRLKTGADGSYTFMNTKVLETLEVPLPPISYQDTFARIFEQSKIIKKLQLDSENELRAFFNALMQKILNGELCC